MALADLLQVLQRDADAEIAAITASAAVDATRIDEEAATTCRTRLTDALRRFADEQRVAAEAEIAAANHRARSAVLVARAAMLERVRAALLRELPALVDDAVRTRLAAAARRYAPDGTIQNVPTGVIVERADGTRIEATLEAIVDAEWPRLAAAAIAEGCEIQPGWTGS